MIQMPSNAKRLLASNETIRSVPPFPVVQKCECCPDNTNYTHTIVPRQIEDAARAFFGSLAPCKVYGNTWLLPNVAEGSKEWEDAVAEAIKEAEDRYEYEEDESMDGVVVTVGSDSEEVETELFD